MTREIPIPGLEPATIELSSDFCARYGVEVDSAEYLAGWRAGYDEWDRLRGSFRNMSR